MPARGLEGKVDTKEAAVESSSPPMAWYKRTDDEDVVTAAKRSIPVGVFTKCPGCREALLTADLKKNLDVCPKCDHHFLMATRDRIALMVDEGSFVEVDTRIESIDPLGF